MKMAPNLKVVSVSKCFGGQQYVYSHWSDTLKCNMKFSLYSPPQASNSSKVPVIYFLSGLFSSEQELITQSGFQKYAAQHGICVVGPDTYPREAIPGEERNDICRQAAMYVDAEKEDYCQNYRMYSYVTQEFINMIEENFNFIEKSNRSVMGHSMGGFGAMIVSLKNPGMFKSCSALAPLFNVKGASDLMANLIDCDDDDDWKNWCPTYLISKYSGPPLHLRIDQGAEDYILGKFHPHLLIKACVENKFGVQFNLHEGYDHAWHFVSTFIGEQIEHHAKFLKSNDN